MDTYYAEIVETEVEETDLPQFMRVEVSNEAEASKVLSDLEPYFSGRKYEKRFHIHKHRTKMPCEVKVL